jgi:ferredoxin-type protein NapF
MSEQRALDPTRRAFLQAHWKPAPEGGAAVCARIQSSCLTFKNVACESCRDVCECRAIRFLRPARIAVPTIVPELCTACGECLRVCPADAIVIADPENAAR